MTEPVRQTTEKADEEPTKVPDVLAEAFDTLVDAPNGIPKLREMILDLAVRGKLVPQEPDDEPASELLGKIELERERLVKAKKKRKLKKTVNNLGHEKYFALPRGWEWTCLGKVATQITDGVHKTPKYQENGIPFASIKDISSGKLDLSNARMISIEEHKQLMKRCQPQFGDILITRIGTLGKCVMVDTEAEFSIFVSLGLIKYPQDKIYPRFLLHVLNSPFLRQQYEEIKAGGSHTNKINLTSMPGLNIPIAPLSEQKRIVAKVDSLMALCDDLETARNKRNTVHVNLHKASLKELGEAEDAEQFSQAWRRVADNFDILIQTPESVSTLRQTILDLAVRGKLVPQDPNDEPASELLKRIEAKKDSLKSQKHVQLPKLAKDLNTDKLSFEIPSNWVKTFVTNLFFLIPPRKRNVKTKDVKKTGKYPVVDQGKAFIRGYIDDKSKVIQIPYPVIIFGDHTREIKLVDFDFVVGADGTKILCPIEVLPAFFFLVLRNYRLESRGYGRHYRLLTRKEIPLPPLPEQKRIVAKVDSLMAICDKLESQLETSKTISSNLATAIAGKIHA